MADINHTIDHVRDQTYFELPHALVEGGKLHIPDIMGFQVTKFMLLEVLAAVLIALIFIPLAQFIATGNRPRGKIWNMFEAMLIYIRDEVARPAIGHHDADRFLPLLWTLFFFVLGCNLLGMLPWLGSPTGALSVTLALAIISFVTVVGAGMAKSGFLGFFKSQVPHMELPFGLGYFLFPLILVLELVGLLIKHFVLSVRLFANMFAGHLVLAFIMSFIALTAANVYMWAPVTFSAVLGAAALSLLELFVAFLQAYLFTFLTALFIGMSVHPH